MARGDEDSGVDVVAVVAWRRGSDGDDDGEEAKGLCTKARAPQTHATRKRSTGRLCSRYLVMASPVGCVGVVEC
jgi:hypothetical protein